MEKTNGKTILVLTIAASMLLSITMIAPARAQATTIGVEPNKTINYNLQTGSTFTVEVWVRDATNLGGAEFKLGYNTSVLTATSVLYGGIFGSDPSYYYEWVLPSLRINDAEGWVRYGVSYLAGGSPLTGDGRVATITFTVDSYGSCSLHLYETQLGDSNVPPYPIEHTTIDGYFSNKPGDADGDRDVDYDDFIILAGAYGSSLGQPAYKPNADFDVDGDVDYDDFILLAGSYGKSVP